MSKRESDFQRRGRCGLRLDFMLRGRALAGIVAIVMGASLIFSGNVSAHNIDMNKAREAARNYARQVRDESGGKYTHYSTSCVAAFPGHNHIARCLIDYKNEEDTKKGVYTCRELVEIKLLPHHSGIDYTPRGVHVSTPCGNLKLTWTPMS